MKLFYKVDPSRYREMMEKVRDELGLHEEIDEAATFLMEESEDRIEQITGRYNPAIGGDAMIRVVLVDESLKDFLDSVFGEPYKVK
ncbi:hypothetical protein EU537_12445 [Candidatus Thorarchaeota archaeon]|nr:MAG: hypothetical protein EU537_12445 [Candidatus Thorarchaeota archaeon]